VLLLVAVAAATFVLISLAPGDTAGVAAAISRIVTDAAFRDACRANLARMRERLARLAVAKSAKSAAFSLWKMPRSVARAATRARS